MQYSEREATYMQGHYCSKPMEEKSFEVMLHKNNGVCSIPALHVGQEHLCILKKLQSA